jgi:hypothetical protein
VTIEAERTELHHHKSALEIDRAVTVDHTNAQARARDVVTTINHEGVPSPAFSRVILNVVVVAAPSTNGANKVYHQLKNAGATYQ